MVHEGFWDLYCKKPATPDLNVKKLEGWTYRILLKVPTIAPPDEEGTQEGEPAEAQPGALPVKAVVRVRIPFKRPEPAEGEGGEEGGAEAAPAKEDAEGEPEATIEE